MKISAMRKLRNDYAKKRDAIPIELRELAKDITEPKEFLLETLLDSADIKQAYPKRLTQLSQWLKFLKLVHYPEKLPKNRYAIIYLAPMDSNIVKCINGEEVTQQR